MAAVVITGDTSGSVTLQAPAVAGTTTLTLPSTSGTVLTTASTTGISGSAISSGTVAEAYGGTGTTTGYYGFKNRIINGAMMIDQRNAGASQTITSAATYFGVDRFRIGIAATNAFSLSVQQVSDAPSGFLYSQKYTVNTGTTLAASDTFQTGQRIEYANTCDFGWFDSTSRYYVATYTINSANTWEQKTITVASPIAGGVTTTLSFWVKSSLTGNFSVCFTTSSSPSINGTGLYVVFDIGQGSTYQTSSLNTWTTSVVLSSSTANRLIATTGATLQITGVQLEKGSTATSFDYRPYGTELALCMRYYQKLTYAGSGMIAVGISWSTTTATARISLLQEMRSAPTITLPSAGQTAGTISFLNTSSYPSATGSNSATAIDAQGFRLDGSGYTGLAGSGYASWLYPSNTAVSILANAEL